MSSNSNNRDNEEGNQTMKKPVSTMSGQSKSIGTPKNTTIQVLVSSNSNNPAALRSETKSGVEVSSTPFLKDQTKFKSLGDLHMEKGLPSVPR